MAESIISGLFGLNPYEVQRQRNEQASMFAAKLAEMDAAQRGVYGLAKGGAGLARIGAGMMGMVDPVEEESRQLRAAMQDADMDTPEGLRTLAQRLQSMGMQEQAMIVATRANELGSIDLKNLYGDIAPKDYTQESLAVYQKTKNPSDLIPREKKEAQPTSIDEYKFAQSQGYKGTFQEWLKTKAKQIHIQTGIDSDESAATPEVVDFYAQQQLLTGDQSWRVGLGRSKRGMALILAVDKRIPSLAKEAGMTPAEAAMNKQEFAARLKAIKDFATGMQGQMINSFNTAIDHLDTLLELGKALKNGNIQAINLIGNKISQWTGGEAPTNLNTAKQIIGAEVIKSIVARGGGQAEREEAANQISMISSPAQLVGYINTAQRLMGGQLKSLKLQYETTTKRKDFEQKLTPRAGAIMNSLVDGASPKLTPAERERLDELRKKHGRKQPAQQ